MSDREVQLRTGVSVSLIGLSAVLSSLEMLFESNPFLAHECVMLAKDPDYLLWGDCGRELEQWGLLESGKMHQIIRDVILAAVVGDGLTLTLIDPRAPSELERK